MNVVAIIPARLHARRLPRKVLQEIAGKPMIQWVYERVQQARRVTEVYIATDAPEVEAVCRRFTANVVRTSPAHRSGTDRIAEVARTLDAEVIVNVQGDEPLIDPALVDRLAALAEDPALCMASAMTPLHCIEDVLNPNVVKVVSDAHGYALYFSRAPIPWLGNGTLSGTGALPEGFVVYKHIGIYLYRREALLAFAEMPPAPLEHIERLEQLRALANGWRIRMLETAYDSIGVDTPEDLEKVRTMVNQHERD